MMKKTKLLFLVGVIASVGLLGCSSNSTKDEEDGDEIASEAAADSDANEGSDGGIDEGSEVSETDEEVSETDELDGDDWDVGDESLAAGEEDNGEGGSEGGDENTVGQSSDELSPSGDDIGAEEPQQGLSEEWPPAGGDLGSDVVDSDIIGEPSAIDSETESSTKSWVPVKKIESTPFQRDGIWLNGVYLVRPGDNLSSISQKIYNQERSSDLLKWNGHLSRGVKVGDKVYYNSPRRSNDSSTMKVYYDDIGAAPEVYEAKPGENIRMVSEKLLGDKESWKEIWATNDVESKWTLASSVSLKYWPSSEVLTPVSSPMPQTSSESDLPELAANGHEVDDLDNMDNMDNIDPPPPPPPLSKETESSVVAGGAIEPPPPPPPPPPLPEPEMRASPPPPPPPPPPPLKREKSKKTMEAMDEGGGEDLWMMIGGAVLAVALIGGFIVIRKKRGRNMDLSQETSF